MEWLIVVEIIVLSNNFDTGVYFKYVLPVYIFSNTNVIFVNMRCILYEQDDITLSQRRMNGDYTVSMQKIDTTTITHALGD